MIGGNMEQANTAQKTIKFNFQLYNPENGDHVVEKADSTGQKRRYIRGISSGILTDGDGERMTMNAINSMHSQGKSEDILLYQGKHGVNFADDIGILTDSDIVNNRDWYTEYRLYDEADGMGPNTLERVDKVFRQLNGLPPYTKKKEYGFSIEGLIPPGGIISQRKTAEGDIRNRVIDKIELQGVVLVGKPSYPNVASAIYKALGELHPAGVEKLHKNFGESFRQTLEDQEIKDSFFRQYYQMNDALMDQIEKIMGVDDGRSAERLNILLQEYSPAMIELILQHREAFQGEQAQSAVDLESKRELESLATKLEKLNSVLQKRLEAK